MADNASGRGNPTIVLLLGLRSGGSGGGRLSLHVLMLSVDTVGASVHASIHTADAALAVGVRILMQLGGGGGRVLMHRDGVLSVRVRQLAGVTTATVLSLLDCPVGRPRILVLMREDMLGRQHSVRVEGGGEQLRGSLDSVVVVVVVLCCRVVRRNARGWSSTVSDLSSKKDKKKWPGTKVNPE